MARTSKNVRFCEPEVKEYDFVAVKVSWRGAQHHTPGVGEEEMVEFDADRLEREGQGRLSKRVHRLLALGRAAEMRASVMNYLSQGSSSLLPDIPHPRRARRATLPPKPSAQRTRRPAPQARVRNMSADSHNDRLVPVEQAAQVAGDTGSTVSGTKGQSEAASMADVTWSDTQSSAGGADGVAYEGDELVPVLEEIEPRCLQNFNCTAERSHMTEGTSDDSKMAKVDNKAQSDIDRQFWGLSPQEPPGIGAPALTAQPPLSPVPPCVGAARPRPRPPPHRKFWREAKTDQPSESVQDLVPATGVHLEKTSTPFHQQPSVQDDSDFADQAHAGQSYSDCAEEWKERCADLPQRTSSI
eukprot:TRINITY_DN25270_c0_g1_i3.p1 TRINITY_DN25270_c0_g1~~TRINITY_DN25270_c0_g1_i3.p1  ORF type:complete len:356 (+),score=44.97 TRINITY_DN25270_c0_g1_i3:48-1115(+)